MRRFALVLALLCATSSLLADPTTRGYYRFPTLSKDTIVFTAQGDLFKVGIQGGSAVALTTHPAQETHPALSPDGKWVAFTSSYEGPVEVYVMPIEGGLPTRLTFEGGTVVGWTPDSRVLYTSSVASTLPNPQLHSVDPKTLAHSLLPLSQASDGVYDKVGGTLYFTRLAFQGSHTKRYKGGTAQNIWKLAPNAKEAVPLTANFTGTSKNPMWWNGRIYFVSDRDGVMNLWSMNPNGGDLKQHTRHKFWDVKEAGQSNGKIVYQLGADLHLYDIATEKETTLDISITSDMEQTREHWIKNPLGYLTHTALSPNGDKVVLTARGQVFVAPAKQGRFVEVTRKNGVRYRNALFSADGKSLYALSDESGETEWWRLPVNGVGKPEQLSNDASVLRVSGTVSPDGKWIAYHDKNEDLWLFSISDKKSIKVASSEYGEPAGFAWSPDSQWLAYVASTATFNRIVVYSLKESKATPITTPRSDSYSPAWSLDGKWLYFLSDRTFHTQVDSPWGPRQPEPFFDRQTKIYQLGLVEGLRSPFQPNDELSRDDSKPTSGKPVVSITFEGIQKRLYEVPVPAGNYSNLSITGKRLLWVSSDVGRGSTLSALDITNTDPAVKTLLSNIQGYQISQEGKHLLVRQGNSFHVVDPFAPTLNNTAIDLSQWTFSIQPREEWRQMLVEAWRLERDFFYDPKLHGVDWKAILQRHLPLVERVRDRSELSDLIASMVGELSALHTFVVGGDNRGGADNITPASLGAALSKDAMSGRWRVDRIYSGDPDYPNSLSPLAKPGLNIAEGDLILSINGVSTAEVGHIGSLLRNQAGKQVLIRVQEKATGKVRDCIVTPISPQEARNLRYTDWELTCRQRVESEGKGEIGYVHLRAMGSEDIEQWAKDFYPIFDRQGLIIDVRNNGGGNIDSWILEKLLRRAWFYWRHRNEKPTWNMQWAFRGHIVVLCNEHTGSDGEAFTEGIRRLGLGKIIGTRTWGGEVWLNFDTWLQDNGIASAAEIGVFGPEGKWLIEGHGVDPDMVVDNLPHATFQGEDAQLMAGIAYLQKQIREHPVPLPTPPAYPNKAFLPKN